MFRKVLIANRGEIAVRIIRACKELGVRTVAVYSRADRNCLHARLADEAYCIGKAPAEQSYLNYPEIVDIAKRTSCEAVHPGYGFLSENPLFAEVCTMTGLVFVGPSHEAIARMGEKSVARETMVKAGVPVPRGSRDAVRGDSTARRIAAKVGYPLLVKAAAGGGGKGMRTVQCAEELLEQLHAAQAEARAAFGNPDVYFERFVQNARHVEVQILADNFGNVVHLGERECSIQRRHQKLLEECPSPALNRRLRRAMGREAVRAAKAVGYSGAGTVEFVLDRSGEFFFIEMNTRIQVEHPITEMVTGVDIVKEQLRVAAGERLRLRQGNITFRGHAIECRINAEDPDHAFLPSPGRVRRLAFPGGPGVRVDTHIYTGYPVPPHYDSLLAKLIVHAATRREAIARMKRALEEFTVLGVKNTVPYHRRILEHPAFVKGRYDTGFVDTLTPAADTSSCR